MTLTINISRQLSCRIIILNVGNNTHHVFFKFIISLSNCIGSISKNNISINDIYISTNRFFVRFIQI